MPTAKSFVTRSYKLVNPSNPTQPLEDDDLEIGMFCLNELLTSYAANGLMLTIAKTVSCPIAIGQQEIVFGPNTFLPLPDITLGRLAAADSAWLLLDNLTYPITFISRDQFLASFTYQPLQGLPLWAIIYPDTEVVRIRIYPAASQIYQFYLRGKFEFSELAPTDDMAILPKYYMRYLRYALAKDIAMENGRASAWTPDLQKELDDARALMESASEVNLSITGNPGNLLNGAYRTAAGI